MTATSNIPAHVDMHCHLGWFSNRRQVAREVGVFAVTVTPQEFLSLRDELAGEKNVALAAGLHPWWVRDASDADALCGLLPDTRWVGEIGLDAAPRHAATWDAQLATFERICTTCAETSDHEARKVLSIHAVRSASTVLDVLERTGAAARCRCVLHWFSGSTDELWRAVRLGCHFSLGEHSLATRRGREYARILPAERLLTETDLPEGEDSPATAEDVVASLERTILGMAAARGIAPSEARALVARNAATLLR
ncbi:MAG TPA: TatD family hydrolase [Candidatus Olsenella pullicola]|nr:TatD family hydrolase [Candidatus Olsenella pullicola]